MLVAALHFPSFLTLVGLQMALDISDKAVVDALYKLKDKGEVG